MVGQKTYQMSSDKDVTVCQWAVVGSDVILLALYKHVNVRLSQYKTIKVYKTLSITRGQSVSHSARHPEMS